VSNPGIVIGAPISSEGSLTEGTEVACPYQLACVCLRRDVRTQYSHDASIKITQDRRRANVRYPGDRCHVVAFGGAAEILKLVQPEWPMLAIDEDVIKAELPQNVDHPWRWE